MVELNITEEQLVKKATSGDKLALERLLEDNYRIVKGYLIKSTLNPSLAADLTQETMVKAIINIKKFKPQAKFSSWLITIANNLYRDHLRKTSRESLLEEGALAREEAEWGNPEEKVEAVRLEGVLSRLTYEKRSVVVLKHYYQFSYQEIADILKCPIGTVRSRLHNSLKFIKAELAKEGEID